MSAPLRSYGALIVLLVANVVAASVSATAPRVAASRTQELRRAAMARARAAGASTYTFVAAAAPPAGGL